MRGYLPQGEDTFRPVFALKRYRTKNAWEMPELGFLRAGKGTTVYLSNIFGGQVLDAVPSKEYADVGALLDDGWEVD
jgi:hypothetical protein